MTADEAYTAWRQYLLTRRALYWALGTVNTDEWKRKAE